MRTVEELTQSVVERGEARGGLELPDTIQGVLLSRIDRLGDASRRLLQSAAVIGREVDARLLREIWGESPLDPLVAELKRLEFLYEQAGSAEPVYIFKHVLTPGGGVRQPAAGPPAGLARLVLRRQRGGLAMAARATALCESAGNYEDAGQAYIGWAVSHLYKGEYAEAIAKRADVLRMTGRRFNVRWRARTNVATTFAYWRLGRWADALEHGRQALAVCEQYADAAEAAQAAWTLSAVCIDKGDLERAVEYGALAERSPLPDKRWHLGGLARAWCRMGRHREGLEILSAVTEIFRGLKAVPFSELWASWLAEGYWQAGDYSRARHTIWCAK
jgi:tetratricopeptide (TPR) repeat protein